MSSPQQQVRSYYEHLADLVEAVSAAEIIARADQDVPAEYDTRHVHHEADNDLPVESLTRPGGREEARSPLWPRLAAAVVIFVVGIAVLLFAMRPDAQPAVPTPVPTTIAEEIPTTTLDGATDSEVTTSLAVDLSSFEPVQVPTVVSESTVATETLGDVTWTRYATTRGSMPEGEIIFEPGIGYVAFPHFTEADPQGAPRAYEWRSGDAITWGRRPIPVFDGYDGVSFGTGWSSTNSNRGWWASAASGEAVEYFFLRGDTWTPVSFDDSDRPPEEAADYTMFVGQPVTSGDITLFATTGAVGPSSDRVGDLWVADQAGVMHWVPNPAPSNLFDFGVPIVPVPGGFIMYEQHDGDAVTFWGTEDGRSWSLLGTSTFPTQGRGSIRVEPWSGGLRVFVMSEAAPTYVMESTDAVTWDEAPDSTPLGRTFEASFGYLNVGLEPIEGDLQIFASVDGVSWERILVPADLAMPRIDGGYYEGVAGDIPYRLIVAESGEVHYWIGRVG